MLVRIDDVVGSYLNGGPGGMKYDVLKGPENQNESDKILAKIPASKFLLSLGFWM